MKTANLIRTIALSSLLASGAYAQQRANEPYHGQTSVPNNAAANNQPNQALSGNTPETNSTLQTNREGNAGFNPGWLGLFGLAGLFGLRRGNTETIDHQLHHTHTPELHRG